MVRTALLVSLVLGIPALVSCLVGGFKESDLKPQDQYKGTNVGALIDTVNEASSGMASEVGEGITSINGAIDSLKNTSKVAVHDLSEALVNAGNRIVQMEKKMNWLREVQANKTKREHAHKLKHSL